MNYEQIGKNIRYIRENQLKISREALAEKLGVSIYTINRLENADKHVNNIEIYLKFCKLTGCTIEELLLKKIEDKGMQKTRRNIDYMLNMLNEDQLEYIHSNIRQFLTFLHNDNVSKINNNK